MRAGNGRYQEIGVWPGKSSIGVLRKLMNRIGAEEVIESSPARDLTLLALGCRPRDRVAHCRNRDRIKVEELGRLT